MKAQSLEALLVYMLVKSEYSINSFELRQFLPDGSFMSSPSAGIFTESYLNSGTSSWLLTCSFVLDKLDIFPSSLSSFSIIFSSSSFGLSVKRERDLR